MTEKFITDRTIFNLGTRFVGMYEFYSTRKEWVRREDLCGFAGTPGSPGFFEVFNGPWRPGQDNERTLN